MDNSAKRCGWSLANYGRVSTDDVSAKSVGEMVDFKILTPCISLNSSQMCTHFYKDLVTG